MDEPEVRCANCGFPVPEAVPLQALEGLERERRGQRAKLSKYERETAQELLQSPHYPDACEVLRHWANVCAPKAKEVESKERLAKVIARMNGGYTVEELVRAADGYGRRPYVMDGRRRSFGRPDQKYVDAELVFRDDRHVQAGLSLAETPEEPDPPGWDHIDWRRVRRANHRVILRALAASYGPAHYDEVSRTHHTTCPRCGGFLTVYDHEATVTLLLCACGIDERALFQELADD